MHLARGFLEHCAPGGRKEGAKDRKREGESIKLTASSPSVRATNLYKSNPPREASPLNAATLGTVYNRCYLGVGVHSDHSPGSGRQSIGWLSGFCRLLFKVTLSDGDPDDLFLKTTTMMTGCPLERTVT